MVDAQPAPETRLAPQKARRTIGSYFESPDRQWVLDRQTSPPWCSSSDHILYAQTGRQISMLIERALAGRGIRSLVVPSHLCDSMVLPFSENGWSIIPVRMDPSLSLDVEDLRRVVRVARTPVAVLAAEYFGRLPSDDYVETIKELDAAGIPVIEDETHRVLRPGGSAAEFRLASLRKLLPVADGAYLIHRGDVPPVTGVKQAVSTQVWNHMDKVATAIHDDGPEAQAKARVALSEMVGTLEGLRKPSQISARTSKLLRHLDFGALAERRMENARELALSLEGTGIEVLNSQSLGAPPSHLIIRVSKAKSVQRLLAEHGYYCPVHWARSTILPPSIPWRDDLLSLPVDHRYDTRDMQRFGSVVKELVAK